MNKKGQTIAVGIISTIFIFLFGVLFISFVQLEADQALNKTTSLFANEGGPGLDCDNKNISDGSKVACLGAELAVPYFIILVISLAGGAIISRLLR